MSGLLRSIADVRSCYLAMDEGNIEKFIGGAIMIRTGGITLNFNDMKSAEACAQNMAFLLKTLRNVSDLLRESK